MVTYKRLPGHVSGALQLLKKNVVKRPRIAIAAVFFLFLLWGSVNPNKFINLWLTPDQQGMLFFIQENYGLATKTFSNQQWIAYSYYAEQDFEMAAKVWGRSNQREDQFAQANAMAHNNDFSGAAIIYRNLLATYGDSESIKTNLALVEELKKLMPDREKKSGKGNALRISDEITDEKQEEDTVVIPGMLPTDEMWLEQVKANPAFFLQKKFMLEYDNLQHAKKLQGSP